MATESSNKYPQALQSCSRFVLLICGFEGAYFTTYLLSLFLCQFVIDIVFDCRAGALVNDGIPEWHLQEVGYH